MCDLEAFADLELDSVHREILETELDLWHRIYLPCRGKDVLDIGAGNGETARFFLNHGARSVVCIEPDTDLLKKNFGKDARITIVSSRVTLIKSDCEGGEMGMIVEIHRPHRWRRIAMGVCSRNTVERLEEYWGNPFRKAVRLFASKLIERFY